VVLTQLNKPGGVRVTCTTAAAIGHTTAEAVTQSTIDSMQAQCTPQQMNVFEHITGSDAV